MEKLIRSLRLNILQKRGVIRNILPTIVRGGYFRYVQEFIKTVEDIKSNYAAADQTNYLTVYSRVPWVKQLFIRPGFYNVRAFIKRIIEMGEAETDPNRRYYIGLILVTYTIFVRNLVLAPLMATVVDPENKVGFEDLGLGRMVFNRVADMDKFILNANLENIKNIEIKNSDINYMARQLVRIVKEEDE